MAEAASMAQGNLEPPGATAFDRFFLDVFDEFAHPHRFRLEDGAAETLQSLQSRGIATGLLSNWDARLRSIIEASDIRPLLDVTIISAEAGYEKPNPGIFAAARAAAEAALGAPIDDPATIFLVGDSPGDDVAAARQAGWTPLLFEPSASEHPHSPAPAAVIRRLSDVLAMLD
jgi:FMN phosphatase YigB (HAD superfamily)